MEDSKDIGWYLDVDCTFDAFSSSMDAMLALFVVYCFLNVDLQLLSVSRGQMHVSFTYLNLP